MGIGPDGEHVRASGWGPAFLDGGSGYDIGEGWYQGPKHADLVLFLSSKDSVRACQCVMIQRQIVDGYYLKGCSEERKIGCRQGRERWQQLQELRMGEGHRQIW